MAFAEIAGEVNCFKLSGNKVCDLSIKVVGEIVATSPNEIKSFLDDANPQTNWVYKQLIIDSPGGNVDASMAIGRLSTRRVLRSSWTEVSRGDRIFPFGFINWRPSQKQ